MSQSYGEDDGGDDNTLNLTVFPDDPPSSGEWVDTDDALASLTDEEAEEGRRMGEEIDPDDDDDTGMS